MSAPAIRPASLEDLEPLLDLEEASFDGDRLTRRRLRHLLTRANAAVFVAEDDEGLTGSMVVLFRRTTGTAHVYSIAVARRARGQGVGRRLLDEAEREAWRRERAWMRAEIRKDNTASIRLFESCGYRRFGEYEGYYEDEMDAWRVEKTLDPSLRPSLARLPYYRQTLDFTCGPAALMMAMAALGENVALDRTEELRIWREATTIFMTSGHGGCGPYGLALAARRRGFRASVVVSDPGVHMVDTVRSPEKQEVMRLVQDDMEREIRRLEIPVEVRAVSLEEIERRFDGNEIPLILISSWQIWEERVPHWVAVTGFDDHFVYVHDPWLDPDDGEALADVINMPIGRQQFRKMSRFGRRGLQTAVFIGAPEES